MTTDSAPEAIPRPNTGLAPSKIRHEWFQNDNFVTVTVFVKNLPKENVQLNLEPRVLSLSVKLPNSGGTDYSLELDPLAHEIIPAESKHSVLSTKIEIKLKKAEIGIKWGALEGQESGPVTKVAGAGDVPQQPPAYPSSARKRVDWSKVEKQAEEDKAEGEDALNSLFAKIYKDADPEAKKAMMKSFTESGGTVLSTNWKDVGTKYVEPSPPDGMEARKW
ncbi:SGS-domain-containing protein [Gonapodya prolifera JEL478]|uniref:SGS-domain-containing protein n=1 Tax=Gonapodya prolifera (strain JEL478) TaxID=1344416 RepID=A0A139AXC2_GONPJ|nr:SGS-domain-containing protein [Gonapodya prolifera JEL478]|eukprot:KXS21370.1 SGS-domain-containing protein [Gonapodya prolifera JEL478]